MSEQRIDPRIYGAEDVPPQAAPTSAGLPAGQYTAPAVVPASTVVQGSALLAQGAATLKANQRKEATVLESVGASMSQWLPAHVYEHVRTPTFAFDQGFNAAGYLREHVEFQTNKIDADFILQAKSAEDAAHRAEVLRSRNLAYEAMGDHGVASFLTGALDPTYLAIDVASMGAARVLRAGRLAAGGTAAGLTVGAGVVESEMTPTTAEQIVLNSLAMGAASAMFFRHGKIEPRDPGYPSRELGNVVEGNTRVEPTGLQEVAPAPLTTSRVAAGGEGNAKLRYGDGTEAPNIEYNPSLNLSRAEQSALVADGRVMTVQTIEEIASHSPNVRSGRTVVDADAKAVYLPNEDRIFVVQQNIKPGDDVKGIMLHEYGVHMNAERVLGTETLGKMLDRLEDLALAGNKRAKQAFDDVPRNTEQHLVREEALGYYIERNHANFKDNFVTRFIASMKDKLRQSGLAGLKLSEADIVHLVRKAVKGGAKAEKASFDATFPHAWHGSPVKGIDGLKTEFIGTGEGAQAFGWGHYLTSEKGTALDYRNKESLRRGRAPEDGGLYRVKINAEEHQFIDLDKTVQSPTVAAVFAKLEVPEGLTGKQAYAFLSKRFGGDKAASEALYSEGLAGNRYATGRTRMADVKSSNYVLFNDALVDISARYSKGIKQTAAQAVQTVKSSKDVARALEWSWHKTFGSYSPKSKEVADLLFDDPLNPKGNSAASIQRAVRADLSEFQYAYESALLDAMGAKGYGLAKRIFNTADATKVQQALERDVYMEMLRRNRAATDGVPLAPKQLDPAVKTMADKLDALSARSLKELQEAGVDGADLVAASSGYVTRRWDVAKVEAIERRLLDSGMDAKAARQQIVDTISIGIQRSKGWDAEVADDVAGAIFDRTKRKGMFQDIEFSSGLGDDGTAVLRSILSAEGLSGARLQRVMDVLDSAKDEAGKMNTLKSRIDMHMDEALVFPDGSRATIADMLDTNVSVITDRYLDTVSARVAMAKKGLKSPTDIRNMQNEVAQSIPDLGKREEAVKSFKDALNVLQGNPVGEDMLSGVRNAQAVTQMVGLAASGLWQTTEYATVMAKYGAGRVVKEMLKELPIVRDVLKHEPHSLREVLARNSSQDTRLRPFISRMEDNFEIPMSDSVKLSLMQAKQLVPYANAMKYIQHHQARVTANLIVDIFHRAAKGDVKAMRTLEAHGLESGSMTKARADILAHGMDTSKWSHATWSEVRAPLTKMMDESVLRARLGEMPQFAHTSTLGKFLFTFRSFVLAAHNKVLANTLHNSGYTGLGLLLLYQIPMTVLATAANTALSGKPQEDLQATVAKAFGQVGALGLFSELFGVLTGNKQQFGAPGLIGVDRMYKAVGSLADGSAGNTAAAVLNATPVMSAILPVRAIGEALKDKEE